MDRLDSTVRNWRRELAVTSASVSVVGLSPGRAYVTLNDGLAAANVWVPTGTTSDGYPGQMVPFPTGTANVT